MAKAGASTGNSNGSPYYKPIHKSKWLGIKVIKVNERNTSKTCHRCGNKGLRVGSLFKCLKCGYSCNADYNGAMNILKRGMSYMLILRAGLTQPRARYDEGLSLEEPRISRL
jgi:ribosomal protein L37E